MFTAVESVSIARSAGEVFAFLTDAANRPRWDTTVLDEELTSPPPVRVGTTIHTRMRAMGREVEYDWRVSGFDPPARMTLVSTAGMMATTFMLDVVGAGPGCEVTATIEASPTGLMRLAEGMIAETVRAQLAESLARAAAILEGRSAA